MGAAKKQRTIDYFKRQSDAEIKACVDEMVKKLKLRTKSYEESQDETKITVIGG